MKITIYTSILVFICLINVNGYCQAPDILWEVTVGKYGDDHANKFVEIGAGQYVVSGHSTLPINAKGKSDFWLVQIADSQKIWERSYGGSENDYCVDVKQTSDGGYIIVGYTLSTDGDAAANHGYVDMLVIKVNSSGDVNWRATIGGSGIDQAFTVVEAQGGGYIVGGTTSSQDGDISGLHGVAPDIAIAKLSSNGSLQWVKCYGGSKGDYLFSLDRTLDGGYILAGFTYSSDGDITKNHGKQDIWVTKIDANGNLIWEKSYGTETSQYTPSIKSTSDGGYIFIASTEVIITGSDTKDDTLDVWVVKLDGQGSMQWQQTLGGSQIDKGRSIYETNDGGYICLAHSNSPEIATKGGGYDIWLFKLDKNSFVEWNKIIGGSGNDMAECVIQNSKGGYTVSGYTDSKDGDIQDAPYKIDMWLVELSQYPTQTTVLTTNKDVRIYPTINNGTFNIDPGSYKIQHIDIIIYNALGKIVPYSRHSANGIEEFTLLNSGPGIYFLKILGYDKQCFTGHIQVL